MKPRGWTLTRMDCIPVGIPVVIALDGSTDIKDKEEVHVIEKSAFDKVVEALKFIANGCLVPPDGGSPCIDDAIKEARQILKELGYE